MSDPSLMLDNGAADSDRHQQWPHPTAYVENLHGAEQVLLSCHFGEVRRCATHLLTGCGWPPYSGCYRASAGSRPSRSLRPRSWPGIAGWYPASGTVRSIAAPEVPRTAAAIKKLIIHMVTENPRWGHRRGR